MIKARHTLIYVVILAAIGGYFYYFEMYEPHQKQLAAQAARKVFHFTVDQVAALELLHRDQPPIRLEKQSHWQINEPIKAEVDESSLNGLLSALSGLQSDRQVVENTDDLKPFGLQQAALTVRFKSGDTWQELYIGDLNPVGDSYYVKTGDRPKVFLMARGNWSIFDKGVKDLRRRQLFTFEPQSVDSMEIIWQGGEHFSVNRDSNGVWNSADQVGKVIKKSKADQLLDHIQWLTARDFLAETTADAKQWGLDPPYVAVKLHLKDGQEVVLKLAKEDPGKKLATAASSQLDAIVQVEGGILQQLPKDLHGLEDLSLLSFKPDQVRAVAWIFAGGQGQLRRTDGSNWVWRLSGGKERPLNESWLIRSLLWELDEAEYEHRDQTAPEPAAEPGGYVEFWGPQEKLGAISWERPKTVENATVLMWLMSGEGVSPMAVQVKSEVVQKMEQKLTELNKVQSQ